MAIKSLVSCWWWPLIPGVDASEGESPWPLLKTFYPPCVYWWLEILPTSQYNLLFVSCSLFKALMKAKSLSAWKGATQALRRRTMAPFSPGGDTGCRRFVSENGDDTFWSLQAYRVCLRICQLAS